MNVYTLKVDAKDSSEAPGWTEMFHPGQVLKLNLDEPWPEAPVSAATVAAKPTSEWIYILKVNPHEVVVRDATDAEVRHALRKDN